MCNDNLIHIKYTHRTIGDGVQIKDKTQKVQDCED